MAETPEDVYRAAAEAFVGAAWAGVEVQATPAERERIIADLAQGPTHRAAVDAAYAAGRKATATDHRAVAQRLDALLRACENQQAYGFTVVPIAEVLRALGAEIARGGSDD